MDARSSMKLRTTIPDYHNQNTGSDEMSNSLSASQLRKRPMNIYEDVFGDSSMEGMEPIVRQPTLSADFVHH